MNIAQKLRMKVVFVFLFVLAIILPVFGDSVTDGTELISAFIVNRHGDRTPNESALKFSTNVEALKAASEEYGYGQLTKLGQQRAYELGKFIRQRYNTLLSPKYNKSEIYIRSTDSSRTEMTVLTAMAAVFPAYPGSWSKEINWVPTPYTTVPAKYDILMAALNCPTFRLRTRALLAADEPRMARYSEVLHAVSEIVGVNITETAVMVFVAYDLFISQNNLGICLDKKIFELLPDIKAAADEAIDIVFGNDKLKVLQAGPHFHEFFTSTSKQLSGSNTPRVRVYSAHDGNVYAMVAASQLPRQGVPGYGAMLALELRRLNSTGAYVVLPVYLQSPGEPIKYLQVGGCDLLCPYDSFKKIVSANVLDENTWRDRCGFSEDIAVDTSSL